MAKLRSFSSISLIPKRLFSGTSDTSSALPFTVHYLVNRCRVPLPSAVSAAKKFQIREKSASKADAVLRFLKSFGFRDTHLSNLISRRPRLLLCRPQTTLKPKLDFLIENGFQGSVLHELILKNPTLLRRTVKAHLEPTFDFLRTHILTFEELHTAVRRFVWLLTWQYKSALKPNIEFLLSQGVTPDRISKFIVFQPRAALQSHKTVVEAVESVKRFGVEPINMCNSVKNDVKEA